MIIDPEIEENIGQRFKAYRKLSAPLTSEENEKFFTTYNIIASLVGEKKRYEDKYIEATIQITAQYGDPMITRGMQEIAELLRNKQEFDFKNWEYLDSENIFDLDPGEPCVWYKRWDRHDQTDEEREWYIDIPDAGVYELIIANILKPGQHKSTMYDLFDKKGTRFVFVFGRTKEGEIYVTQARERLIMEDLEKKKRKLKKEAQGSKIIIDPQVIQDFSARNGGPPYCGRRHILQENFLLTSYEARRYEILYHILQQFFRYDDDYLEENFVSIFEDFSERIRNKYGEEMEEAFKYLVSKIRETHTFALESECYMAESYPTGSEPRVEDEKNFLAFLVDVAVSEVIMAFMMQEGYHGVRYYNPIPSFRNERRWYFYGKMEDGTVFCTRLYPKIEYEYGPYPEEIQEAIREETDKWKERKHLWKE